MKISIILNNSPQTQSILNFQSSFTSYQLKGARSQWITSWIISKEKKKQQHCSLKGNELPSHEKTWRKLQCVLLLSETNQSEKPGYSRIPTV